MLVDSHCHLDRLDLTPYEGSLDKAIKFAQQQGVTHFLCVCIDMKNYHDVIAIAERYPTISASVGLHPTELIDCEPSVEELVSKGQHTKIVAIGETGLDYYHQDTSPSLQQARFRQHIKAAKLLNKPLIVHSRAAREDTIRILQEENADCVGGVLHCFTEDWDMAEKAIALNFYISFSGIVTFQNATSLKTVAQKVPLEHMLIETDSPYLAPKPYRGKPNQPAYVRYVAEEIALLKGISFEEVAKKTTENFFKLFYSDGEPVHSAPFVLSL
jgi:TatD DNase family protein